MERDYITKVFLENGYEQMSKDKCVFVKYEHNHVSYCAITVWTTASLLRPVVICFKSAWGGDQYPREDCSYRKGQRESSD